MFSEKVSMWGQHRVDISDILHDILHCPQVGVLTTGPRALPETAWAWMQKPKLSHSVGISSANTVFRNVLKTTYNSCPLIHLNEAFPAMQQRCRRRGLQQKHAGSSSGKMLRWLIKYVQVRIHGRLLVLRQIIINHCAVFWCLMSLQTHGSWTFWIVFL